MDEPRNTGSDLAVETDGDGDGAYDGSGDGDPDRDLRDVLRGLVVAGDGRESVSLSAVAAAAGGSERLLPELLGALTDDATAVRIGAAWTLCALAEDRPRIVEYLTERVVERMDDGDEPFEVGQVLSFLRGRYPGRAGDAVDVAVDRSLEPPEEDARGGRPDRPPGRTGTDRPPTRADGGTRVRDGRGVDDTAGRVPDTPEGRRVETDGGVPAGTVADLGDGRQVVRPDGDAPDVHQRPVEPPEPGLSGPAVPEDHPTHPDFDSTDAPDADAADATAGEPGATDAGGAPPERSSPPVTEETHRPETPETFASLAALSGFDQLSAVDEGIGTRFGSAYRCRAVDEGEERGVSVRLFDRPAECDRLEFCAELEDALARWQALGSEEHVVGVVEWGDRPRPWIATDPVEETLAERDRPPVDEAFWHALRLAEAVSYVHRHGAVHGGIEPRTVVYRGDTFEPLARPALDSPGLMSPFGEFLQPSEYLDPRFAAPEYFDDGFGCIDSATDVYGLGAACYLLFTGRPPATGSIEEIRRQVLDGTPPAPTRVNEALPGAIDDVLSRALAKEKLTRYESARAFYRDVERVRDRSA